MGATDWWFYPLVIAVAALLITVSLGAGPFAAAPSPQRATVQPGGTLVLAPHQLAAGMRVDRGQVLYVARELGVRASAVHLAVRPDQPPPLPSDAGAQLLLDPAQTSALVGVPVRVRITFRRFNVTPASAIAVSLQNGGSNAWETALFPETGETVEIALPPLSGAPPSALGLRMLTDHRDFKYGAAISRIEIGPQAQKPPQ